MQGEADCLKQGLPEQYSSPLALRRAYYKQELEKIRNPVVPLHNEKPPGALTLVAARPWWKIFRGE